MGRLPAEPDGSIGMHSCRAVHRRCASGRLSPAIEFSGED
jgi:hypothetical protein